MSEQFAVVRNIEGQYSVWPLGRDVPSGWDATGFEGPREHCLEHIGEVWTDLRPLSVVAAERR
ncbi:MbtH family protein [Actinomadura terrae]|uniref:MbtH family protein n=1 Tax=Actinomadura terrae TaxID=604353 RepID=UPI001FA7D0C1|nr:MbtH family NRPS accessory protein [Actinomadura terrae]